MPGVQRPVYRSVVATKCQNKIVIWPQDRNQAFILGVGGSFNLPDRVAATLPPPQKYMRNWLLPGQARKIDTDISPTPPVILQG